MPTALQTAIDAALGTVRAVAGESVTYSRGGRSITLEKAVRGSSRIETADDQGTTIRARATDWIIETAALLFPKPARPSETELTTPQPGDRITTAGGEVWEVQPLAGDRHARNSDPVGTHTRIHTRRIQ